MKYMLNNKEINFDDYITKKVKTVFLVGNKEFASKKEAKEYVIRTKKAKKLEKQKFVSYIVKYDFTLDQEIGKPELDSKITEYESDIDWWIKSCERYIDKKNKRYGYETQDGRSIGYIMKYYKLSKGKLVLL